MNQAALAASLYLAPRQGWGTPKTGQDPKVLLCTSPRATGEQGAGKDLLQWGINVGSAMGVGT